MDRNPILLYKTLVVGIIILFIITGFNTLTAAVIEQKPIQPLYNGNTLYVGGSGEGNYTKIQDAIDNASDGDTVFVYSGFYNITNFIIINKSIALIGENKFNTIINGSAISIEVPKVNVSGFTIQNGFGIMISNNFEEFDNNCIYDNIFKSSEDLIWFSGITISNSSYNTISDNTFINCSLMIVSSYHNSINNNTINDKPLVYFEGASNEVIDEAGQVILIDCQDITVENLELNNLFISIEMIDSFNCLISHNKFSNNAIAGFFINSSNNIISGNIFLNNFVGLGFIYCRENNLTKNSFKSNGGILFFETSTCNLVSYNNFKYTYKSFNLNIISVESDNKWFKNFWNRPRLLPKIIWNFKTSKLKNLPLMPTFPDIDWRPAIKPNEINGADSDYTEPIVLENNIKISHNSFFNMFLDRLPLLEGLLYLMR